jgi:class 3 adenylate cyclase/tetratricopeptide (TPR) repeat protein
LTEKEDLQRAIIAQESLRGIIDDHIIDATLAALREKLAALPHSQPASQQRKQVTVLFMDIVGSTTIVRDLDPEDNLAIMDTALERFAVPVEQYGGRVTRFMGDGFVALFGDPVAQENDPEMAIRAGLGILKEAQVYAREVAEKWHILDFSVRVGINTGLIVIGGYSEAGDTLMGSAVNLAARMEEAAPAGGLLISLSTYQHVKGVFEVEPQAAVTVKGFHDPVPVFLVRRAQPRSFRMGQRGVEGIQTQLIGREAEMQVLQTTLTTVVANRAPVVLTVVGEAGLGKSRLLDEFEHWLELQPQQVQIFKGRERQDHQVVPFGLVRDMFVIQYQILDDDPAAVVWDKLEEGIQRVLTGDPQAQMKAHFIGQLLGFDFRASPHLVGSLEDPQQIRDRGQGYLLDFIREATAQLPAVIFLEDIHWADDSSLDTISRLGLGLSGRPVMVVCLARPALFERRPNWGAGHPFQQRLALKPLSTRDSQRLVEDVLQKVIDVPVALRDLIVRNAEGNPFYVEELVKMLVEDGVVVKAEPFWQVDPDRLVNLRVPATLTGVLQARLDSLSAGEQIVLQQAAVAGRVFWNTLLAELNQRAPRNEGSTDIDLQLKALLAREMIFEQEESAFASTLEFIFKHALLREVAYEGVLKRVRRVYHGLVADWLIAQGGERGGEYLGVIATHLERGGREAEARIYYQRSGDQAAASYANEEAVRSYGQAIALTPENDPESHLLLLLARERVNELRGDREAQRMDLEALTALMDQMDNHKKRAEVEVRWARYAERIGAHARAIESAEQAANLARGAGAVEVAVAAHNTWARALWKGGAPAQARTQAEAGLAMAREAGDLRGERKVLITLGSIAWETGDLDLSLSLYERSLHIAREVGDRRGEAETLNNLGAVAASRENYLLTQDYLKQCLKIVHEIGNRQLEGSVLGNLGLIAARLGEYKLAREYYERGLLISREVGDRRSEGIKLSNLGWLAAKRGAYPLAKENLEQSLGIARASNLVWLEAECLTGLGHTWSGLGEGLKAEAAYWSALALDRELGQDHRGTEPLAGLARVALANGDLEEALARVEEILAYTAQSGSLAGAEEPHRITLTCYRVLKAVQDPRAAAILEAGYTELQRQADSLPSSTARKRYLENIPWHRELVEARESRPG